MKTLAYTLTLALVLSACKPMPLMLNRPDGSDEYKEGWDHGCDAAAHLHGEFWLRMTHDVYKNPELSDDEDYIKGWDDGKSYCGDYMSNLPATGPVGEDGWFWYGDSVWKD